MPEYLGKLAGTYISVVLGLALLKTLGWFGLGAMAWGTVFIVGLAPVVLSLLVFAVVFVGLGLAALAKVKS